MRFDGAGSYLAAAVDVDPVATPQSVLPGHILSPRSHSSKNPVALHLALSGTGSESVTLTLYYLVEDRDVKATPAEYIDAGTRWVQFDSAVVVTNGAQTRLTDDLPAGGIIYGRRTADTITGGQTRRLYFAWGE